MEGMEVIDTLANTFSCRRVLVTGHTGFKGSWLAVWLHRLGASVSGYALDPPTKPSNFESSRVAELLEHSFMGDIRDHAYLSKAVDIVNPEIIFHLAAQALVRESYRKAVDTFDVNVIGTARLLEILQRRARPCVVVIVTSDKCYENREQVWGYRECDPMGGYDPYSSSKAAAELLVASYRQSFFDPNKLSEHGVKLASARAGNVIGGGDWAPDRIVPDIVRAVHACRPVEIRNPDAIRPWQHVLEPLSGYLVLAQKMFQSEDPRWCSAWNFGPITGEEERVGELATTFCSSWSTGRWIDISNEAKPYETGVLRLSIEKAIRELGWHPRWSFATAIEKTVRWYRQYFHSPEDTLSACLNDIEAYVQQQ